jgi:hypothetical protein
MGSPTLRTLQEPILLKPWVCFRGGGTPTFRFPVLNGRVAVWQVRAGSHGVGRLAGARSHWPSQPAASSPGGVWFQKECSHQPGSQWPALDLTHSPPPHLTQQVHYPPDGFAQAIDRSRGDGVGALYRAAEGLRGAWLPRWAVAWPLGQLNALTQCGRFMDNLDRFLGCFDRSQLAVVDVSYRDPWPLTIAALIRQPRGLQGYAPGLQGESRARRARSSRAGLAS